MTNDGDLAAQLLKNWNHLEQAYQLKIKGMLTLADLDRLGKETGVKMKVVRQPDASRSGGSANYWYEVRMQGPKLEPLRRLLFREHHPVEKVHRIALGPLSVEHIPRGRYRVLDSREVDALTKSPKPPKRKPR